MQVFLRAGEIPADLARFFEPVVETMPDVFNISTQPYPEAHFATFPEELVRRCIAAGCPEQVCRTCGEPRRRVVEVQPSRPGVTGGATPYDGHRPDGMTLRAGGFGGRSVTQNGWTDCGHGADYRPGVVLDPFVGSGTTALVARRMGRRCVGIDLSPDYLALAARRLQQLSLFAGDAACA